MGRKKSTVEDFIKKSEIIHKNKYDYSLVEYINNSTKIKIICPIHGIFLQSPLNHLQGKGCKDCANANYRNDNHIIDRCKKKYNYDYSLVNYESINKKVKIICPEHGIFEQLLKSHLNMGCPLCYEANKIKNIINKAKNIHKDKYDYSLVEYINNSTKVKIICPVHGIFEQTPSNHIDKKQGCPKCANKNITTDEFINKAKNIHNDKYDYSLVDYNGTRQKIKIICHKHGIFEQTPEHHLRGCGCSICNDSKGENKVLIILNEKNINFIRQYKFDNCKNKRKLPFDFYLPDLNMCIEFDGEQHFREHKVWCKLEQTKINDNIKNAFCENNGIELIRIKFDDDIKKIINNNVDI